MELKAGLGKVEQSFEVTIMGMKLGTTQGGCVESVRAAANVEIYYDSKKGNLVNLPI